MGKKIMGFVAPRALHGPMQVNRVRMNDGGGGDGISIRRESECGQQLIKARARRVRVS
jgi:hypothetical protein